MRGKFTSFHKATRVSHHGGGKGAQSTMLPARHALNTLQTQMPMPNLLGNYAKATPGPADQPDPNSMSASPSPDQDETGDDTTDTTTDDGE